MLRTFKELYSVDLTKYVSKKPTFKRENGKLIKLPEKYWLDYIEWSTVVFLLYENGAESVTFDNELFPDGSLIKNNFIKVKVVIDGKIYQLHYPIIKGNISLKEPEQLDIHTATMRAFVKCVAINTGLGLKLWQKEEKEFSEVQDRQQQETRPRLPFPMEKYSDVVKWLKNGGSIEKLRNSYEIDEDLETRLFNDAL